MSFKEKLLSFLYPKKCAFCKKVMDHGSKMYICKSCLEKLPRVKAPYCARCGRPLGEFSRSVCNSCLKNHHVFSGSFTPLVYTDFVRKAILSMKFYSAAHISRALAFLIAECVISRNEAYPDFVTYVPLSEKRLHERGYDQSYLIARFLAETLGLPIFSTLTHKDGFAKQSTLSHSARRENAKKSFVPKDIKLSGKALLVDDVYTTGATIDTCARHLLSTGCEEVYIATAAIVE